MKTLTEILSQLERVEYRYMRYNPLYAYQIGEILEVFKRYEDLNDKWSIQKEKIQEISQDKLHRNLNALKDFNKTHNTNWSVIEYLFTCKNRKRASRGKMPLIHPHSFPKIHKNMDLLKDIGFSDEELNRYLLHTMRWTRSAYLNYTPQRNKSHIDRLKNDLGFSDDQIKMFIHQVSDFFYSPLEKYQDKLSYIQQTWFTKEEMVTIISWFPHCLHCSEERIAKTHKKVAEITAGSVKILVQYPHLYYFNPDKYPHLYLDNPATDFFRRLVLWLIKWHKRYQRIIQRIQERFSYGGTGENYIRQPLSEEEYLDGLRTEEHKWYFLFNPEERKKSFSKYRDHAFTECRKYLSKKEQDFIKKTYEKDQKGKRLSEQEVRVFRTLMEKRIRPKDPQLYNDLVKIFSHKESYVSRLQEENDDDLPF